MPPPQAFWGSVQLGSLALISWSFNLQAAQPLHLHDMPRIWTTTVLGLEAALLCEFGERQDYKLLDPLPSNQEVF